MYSTNKTAINVIEELFKNEKNSHFENILRKVEKLLPKSINILKDILDDCDTGLDYKFKVAKYIIDLSPLGKDLARSNAPHFVTAMIQNFSPSEIAELKRNADAILEQYEKNITSNEKDTL